MKLITGPRVLRIVAVLGIAALNACGSGRSLPPVAPSPPVSGAALSSDAQAARVWIVADKGGLVSLPDGGSVSVPAGLLAKDGYVTVSSAPRGSLPSVNLESISRSVTVSFSAPTVLSSHTRAVKDATVPTADLRISVPGLPDRRLGALALPTAMLLEFSSSVGPYAFLAAPDVSRTSPGQPATVSLTRSLLTNVSEIKVTMVAVTRFTDSIPLPQYLYVSGDASAWRNSPNLAPHKRTLVLVHGINATAESAFPADCANDIRMRGHYDQIVGFNYDYTLPPLGAYDALHLGLAFGGAPSPKNLLVAFVKSLNQDSVDIEAHSYGTVISLAALPELSPLIKNVVLLAGPLPKRGLGTISTPGGSGDIGRPTRLDLLLEQTLVARISPDKALKMSADGWVDDLVTNSERLKSISQNVFGMANPPKFIELAATSYINPPFDLGVLINKVFNDPSDPTDGAVSEASAWSTDFISRFPSPGSVVQKDFPTTHNGLPCDLNAKQFVQNSLLIPAPAIAPSVASILPTQLPPDGQGHQLTIIGSSFFADDVVQFKRGQGSTANTWTTEATPTISSGAITISLNSGTATDTISVRVCRAQGPPNCSDGMPSVSVTGLTYTPSISSISPTSMTAGGQSQRLTIYGGPFAIGNVVQFKWGQGLGAGVWTLSRSTPAITSSQITVSMNAGTVADTIFVRVCETSAATNCSDGIPSISVGAPSFLPSISSLNPASMVANGQNQTLYIYGGSFASGDIVQFKRGQGSGANVWTTSGASPTVTSSQITVSMNSGTVPDTVFVRVCRASGSTCSDGTSSLTAVSRLITEYTIPTAGAVPIAITSGPDGALWFTEYVVVSGNYVSKIGRITTSGVVTNEYIIPPAYGPPRDIRTGPDGALWFTGDYLGGIGRMTTSGVFNEYAFSAPSFGIPYNLTTGPDGALWFTEDNLGNIGRVTSSGVVTEYNVPTGNKCGTQGITTGSDGALWFTEVSCTGDRKIGRMSTSIAFVEYILPSGGGGPIGITAGPDGALWYTESAGGIDNNGVRHPAEIGRMTTSGVLLAQYTLSESSPFYIAVGADGALWFTESATTNGAGRIGRVTTSGSLTEFATPTVNSGPYGVTLGPDGAIWFTENGSGKIGRISP